MKDTGIVNIHGKEYSTVAKRIAEFRTKYPDHEIHTNLIENTDTRVVMSASIWHNSRKISEGHAEEYRTASQINRTSALENCETSAVGRCLSFMGLGGTQIASADEVVNAIHQQASIKTISTLTKASDAGVESFRLQWKATGKEERALVTDEQLAEFKDNAEKADYAIEQQKSSEGEV